MHYAQLLRLAAALLIFINASGCSKEGAPPPLQEQTFAPELKKAFEKAPAEVRELAAGAVASFEKNDLAPTVGTLRQLMARQDITPQMRSVATQGLLLVNEKLTQAGQNGDTTAQQVMEVQKYTK